MSNVPISPEQRPLGEVVAVVRQEREQREPGVPCFCHACQEVRAATPMVNGVCFGNRPGHGKCIDPWKVGCICGGTASDGECEACWLWQK